MSRIVAVSDISGRHRALTGPAAPPGQHAGDEYEVGTRQSDERPDREPNQPTGAIRAERATSEALSRNEDAVVVVPVHNEAPVVQGVLEQLLAQFQCVVAVDDGSSDGSADAIRRSGAILIQHPFNMGQGAALQTGLEWALGHTEADYFVTFDSDGQHRVEDAVSMVAEIRAGEVDVVLGSRFLAPGSNIPRLKAVSLRLATWLINVIDRTSLTDAHNGLRVFNRRVAEQLHLRENGMAHGTEIITSVSQGGYRYREYPVTISYSEYSLSKGQSLMNGVNILFDMFYKIVGRK